MKTEVVGIKNYRIIVEDRSELFYSIRPFEITNALGVTIGVLHEYFISNKDGDVFKLYKTKEGNWYDFPGVNFDENYSFLRRLKVTLDDQNLE